jgi:hypothetical protein
MTVFFVLLRQTVSKMPSLKYLYPLQETEQYPLKKYIQVMPPHQHKYWDSHLNQNPLQLRHFHESLLINFVSFFGSTFLCQPSKCLLQQWTYLMSILLDIFSQ